MNNINNGEAFGGNVKIFNKEDWLSGDAKISINERAFLCLSHFINHMKLGDNLKILEVGPLPISDIGYEYTKAPISLFSIQSPKYNYLGVGGHKKDNEHTEKFMGDVPFIAGMIDSRYPEMGINGVLKYFEGAPNIVYGRHVFENSSSGEGTFPLGRSFMLDGTAQVLEDGGYLIIDNAFGDYSRVLKGSETYSKHLELVSVYYYEENQGIFIYKKPVNTNKIASQEIESIKNKYLLHDLLKVKQRIESVLQNFHSGMESIEKRKSKIKGKIEKINIQLKKLTDNQENFPRKQEIIENLEESVIKFNSDIELLEIQLQELPDKINFKVNKLKEIESQILDVRLKIELLI